MERQPASPSRPQAGACNSRPEPGDVPRGSPTLTVRLPTPPTPRQTVRADDRQAGQPCSVGNPFTIAKTRGHGDRQETGAGLPW